MIERETGKAARQARRKIRRKEAKHHGAAIPDPEQTTRMVIPEHIAALTSTGVEPVERREQSEEDRPQEGGGAST